MFNTIFGNSKDEPLGSGILFKIVKAVVVPLSYFFKVTFTELVCVLLIVPAITKLLLLAVTTSVKLLLLIVLRRQSYLPLLFILIYYYEPNATLNGIELGSLSVTETPAGKVTALVDMLIVKRLKSSVPSNILSINSLLPIFVLSIQSVPCTALAGLDEPMCELFKAFKLLFKFDLKFGNFDCQL